MQPADLFKLPGLGFKKKDGPDAKYATFNRRMLAATIDSLLIMLFIAPVIDFIFASLYGPVTIDWLALQQEMAAQPNEETAKQLFWHTLYSSGFIVRWLANALWQSAVLMGATAWFWHKWSATPGKMLFRIKIVDAVTEAPISGAQIFLRLFGYFISTAPLLLGFFWIGIDKRRQGWHDKIARTVVIVVPKKSD